MEKTEEELRESKAPWPKTEEELIEYIRSLVDLKHDYGTCVYAISLSAVAAFNYVASKLGCTGFQASCADLDILKRTRSMEGPFMIVDLNKYLFPQYDLRNELEEFISKNMDWVKEQAKKRLAEDNEYTAKSVLAHWKALAES